MRLGAWVVRCFASAFVALATGWGALFGALAAEPAAREQSGAAVALSELPAEARRTIALVRQGGPFPYERDGVVFRNLERLLPERSRGYYREYTVQTPGVKHRGARRIVVGRRGEVYYTDDHYRTFRRVQE